MAIDAIQSNQQVPKTEQYAKVQQQQAQQIPEKQKEEPVVKQQGQTEETGYINTFA
jgi:hypothetical protein